MSGKKTSGNGGRSFWNRFSSDPIGIVGTMLGVVSVVLSLIFYAWSVRQRELTCCVNPVKTVVVKAGQTSRLQVAVDGKKVESDVTAVQVAFWNAGREPIHREHLLKPLVIKTPDCAPIIDATVRKISRDVSRITLDNSRAANGEVVLSWAILEKNDGGVVQLVFAGGAEGETTATATVEGQAEITKLVVSKEPGHINGFAFGSVIAGAVAVTIGIMVTVRRKFPAIIRRSLWWPFAPAAALFCIIMEFVALWIVAYLTDSGPPFGF